jgi:hypothetical protein
MQDGYRFRPLKLGLAAATSLFAAAAHAEFDPQFELSSLSGANGAVLNGEAAEDESGTSVGLAGDVNGDGIDDLIIGAPYATTGAQYSGATYVVFGNNQGLSHPFELAAVDGNNGYVATGVAIFDFSGFSVSGAGDVNNDGIDDVAIGAPSATPGDAEAGVSYVVYGSDQGLPSPLSLGDIDGNNGFAINGLGVYSNSGTSVSAVGDVNDDGFDDLVVGSPNSGSGAGTVYVVYGKNQNLPHPFNLAGLVSSDGFKINGAAQGDSLGTSVSAAGDINGDGIDDLILGAPLAGPQGNNPGIAYVIFGNDQGLPLSLNLIGLQSSSGFAINGVSVGDELGNSVSGAGDVNGDGIADLIVGAPKADPNGDESGAAYVVFGSNQGLPHPLALADLDGSNGFAMAGVSAGDRLGWSVSNAGDINQDGIDDIVIGAALADPNGEDSGAAYVLFGSNLAWPATVDLSGLNGTNGFRVNGVSAGDRSGVSVSTAGDFNADGQDDLVVGAPWADPGGDKSGASYLILNASSPQTGVIFADGFE